MTCDCPTVTETELGRLITYTQHGLNCTAEDGAHSAETPTDRSTAWTA